MYLQGACLTPSRRLDVLGIITAGGFAAASTCVVAPRRSSHRSVVFSCRQDEDGEEEMDDELQDEHLHRLPLPMHSGRPGWMLPRKRRASSTAIRIRPPA